MGLMEIQPHPRSKANQQFAGNPFLLLAVKLGTDSTQFDPVIAVMPIRVLLKKGLWFLGGCDLLKDVVRKSLPSLLLPTFEELIMTSEVRLILKAPSCEIWS